MTATGRRGPHLRWRPLPGNLTDRRGATLAPPILLAAALNVAAVAGLAGIAGFHAVYAPLTRIQGPWPGTVPAALATPAIGYYLAHRSIYAAEGGYKLTRRQLTSVVAAPAGQMRQVVSEQPFQVRADVDAARAHHLHARQVRVARPRDDLDIGSAAPAHHEVADRHAQHLAQPHPFSTGPQLVA